MEEDKTIRVGKDDEGDEQPDELVNEEQVNQVQVNEEQVNEDQVNDNQVNKDQPSQTSARQEEIIEPIASQSGANNSESSRDINEPQEQRHSSSRSAVTQNPNSWKSPNAFINFVGDFRASFRNKSDIKQAQILRLAGEHWRGMSDEEKHPYIAAANIVRSKNAKLKINKPGPKRKRRQPKVQIKKRQKSMKKTKIIKALSDSDDSGEESDVSGDSGKTMDSENDSIDSDT